MKYCFDKPSAVNIDHNILLYNHWKVQMHINPHKFCTNRSEGYKCSKRHIFYPVLIELFHFPIAFLICLKTGEKSGNHFKVDQHGDVGTNDNQWFTTAFSTDGGSIWIGKNVM